MKNFIKIGTVALFAVIGMTSCSVQTSLVKRHYNSGYYVNHVGKTSDVDSREQSGVTIRETVAVAPLAKKEDPRMDTAGLQLSVSHELLRNLKPVAADPTRNLPVSASAKDKNTHAGFLPFVPVHVSQDLKDIKHLKGEGEREGLSLFWLVILILLILWLLGIIGGGWGLGILINVILLFALILLILWLLRIV